MFQVPTISALEAINNVLKRFQTAFDFNLSRYDLVNHPGIMEEHPPASLAERYNG